MRSHLGRNRGIGSHIVEPFYIVAGWLLFTMPFYIVHVVSVAVVVVVGAVVVAVVVFEI